MSPLQEHKADCFSDNHSRSDGIDPTVIITNLFRPTWDGRESVGLHEYSAKL